MLWKRWIGNEVRVSHDLFIASKEMHKPSPAHRSGALRQPADEMVGIVRVLDGLNRLRLADDPDFCAAWKAAGRSAPGHAHTMRQEVSEFWPGLVWFIS